MKYYETHFDNYISSVEKYNIHPELSTFINGLPTNLNQLQNIIIYGPSGIGKYSQSLLILKKYSPSELKYEKKIIAQTDKQEYNYKISDVHFEIDMSLLGCNSKLLWNEIFLQIVDIISIKGEKTGIILCKNFHLIHAELLEIFYSYMQQYNNYYSKIKIVFFILTEQLSFIPTNIINNSHILKVKRPDKIYYSNMVIQNVNKIDIINKDNKMKDILNLIDGESLLNIKELRSFPYIQNVNSIPKDVFNIICDNIIEQILAPENIEFTSFRDMLYDILTYNLDMTECLWYIFKFLIENNYLQQDNTSEVLVRSYSFLKYYNNNYRPIYHLESIIFYIINKIHRFNELR